MSKVKVRLADNIARVIFIESDATNGATIGTNLFMPDGTLATVEKLAAYIGVEAGGSGGVRDHRLLRGLTLGDDHPQYVRKDTLTTRGDIYVRGVSTVQRRAVGTVGQLLRSDGTDPLWATLSPVITLGTDLSGNVTLTNLASGTLNSTIVNNAVTDAKLRDSSALSVIGRSANSSGDPADIAASVDGKVLRRSGTDLGFGQIVTGAIDFAVTDRILGRDTTGAGAAEELTLSQVLDMIGSPAKGDILYRDTSAWVRLPVGTDGQIMTVATDVPSWDDAPPSGGTLAYVNTSIPGGNTIANTVTETAFTSSYDIPAGTLVVGSVVRVLLYGAYGTDAVAPTLRIRLKLDSTTVIDTTAITLASSVTARGWCAEAQLVVASAGAGGTINPDATIQFGTGAAAATPINLPGTPGTSLDTTVDQTVTVTAEWGTADADNTITLRQMAIWLEAAIAPDPPAPPSQASIIPDDHPASPDSMDDEFEGTSLDAKWSWIDQGTSTITFDHGSAILAGQADSGIHLRGIEQPVSGTGRWRAKFSGFAPNNFNLFSIGIRNTSNGRVWNFYPVRVGNTFGVGYWDSLTSFNSEPLPSASRTTEWGSNLEPVYVEIEITATQFIAKMSKVGVNGSFQQLSAVTITAFVGSGYDRIGFYANSQNASTGGTGYIEWFRRVA